MSHDTFNPNPAEVLDAQVSLTIMDEHGDLASEDELQLDQDSEHQAIERPSLDELAKSIALAMSHSPFVAHCLTTFSYENDKLVGSFSLKPELIGNPNFGILHGGMTATILDTIGGAVGMIDIYRRNQGSFEEQTKKVKRLATVDLRIDYLSPGRGKTFFATAEVIRMGRKGCTTTMLLVNDEGTKIAHGIASYAF